jgi:hypothetical protein
MHCVDRETGNLIRLPFGEIEREQPVKTMAVMDYLQSIFVERINAHIKRKQTELNVRSMRSGRI